MALKEQVLFSSARRECSYGNVRLCYLSPSFITPEVFTAPYGIFQAKNDNPFVYIQKVL